MLHKGMGNNTNQTRYAIYISYYMSSYVDKESIKKPVLNKEKLYIYYITILSSTVLKLKKRSGLTGKSIISSLL
jgi:hypothetical protein